MILTESHPKQNQVRRATMTRGIDTVIKEIDATIDFDRSSATGRICIRDDVNQDLNKLRHTLAGMKDLLARITNEDASRFQHTRPIMRDVPWEYQYREQIGFTLAVASSSSSRDPPHLDNNFEFVFRTNTAFHYRSPRTQELDNMFGDVASKIVDLEQTIAIELEDRVLEHEQDIVNLGIMLSEFDVLFSFALSATELKLTRPEITTENRIIVQRARHLLQAQTVEEFIPNDVMIQSSGMFEREAQEFQVCLSLQHTHTHRWTLDEHCHRSELQWQECVFEECRTCCVSVFSPSLSSLRTHKHEHRYMTFIGHFVPAERGTQHISNHVENNIIHTRKQHSWDQSIESFVVFEATRVSRWDKARFKLIARKCQRYFIVPPHAR